MGKKINRVGEEGINNFGSKMVIKQNAIKNGYKCCKDAMTLKHKKDNQHIRDV